MAILEIEGKRIEVDDGFLKLRPDQQQSTVEQIASSFAPPAKKQGGTAADSLAQGLTFGFADEITGAVGAGVNSIANTFGKGTGESFSDAYTGIRDAARYNHQAYQENNPGKAMLAELAGGLVTGGVGAAKTGALHGAQKLRKLAAVGASEGAIYGLGSSDADTASGMVADTALGATVGGVTAGMIPSAARGASSLLKRAGSDVGSASDNLYQSAANRLKDSGVDLTTGQRLGSESVKATETTLEGSFFGGAVSDAFDKQRQQLQSRLFKMAGFADDDVADGVLTAESLDRAAQRFGQRYDEALNGKQVNLSSNEFVSELADVEARHTELLGIEQKKAVSDLVNQLLEKATKGPMGGREYQRVRSLLSKRQRQLYNTDNTISELYGSLKDALDNAFEAASGSTRALNEEYAHFRQLDKLFTNNAGAKANRLPLATLANMAQKSPGSREWREMTRAAYQVLGDSTPNSGTATRALNVGPLAAMATDPSLGVKSMALPLAASQFGARGMGADVMRNLMQGAQRSSGAVKRLGDVYQPVGLIGASAGVPLLP